MSHFAQPTLGANAVAVAHHQQANHQSGINRWAPDWAIKIGEIMAQIAEIKASINAAQEVIGWDVIFNVERVKQSLLSARQLSHHAANPPAGRWPNFAADQAGDLLFQQSRPIAAIRDRPLSAKSGHRMLIKNEAIQLMR